MPNPIKFSALTRTKGGFQSIWKIIFTGLGEGGVQVTFQNVQQKCSFSPPWTKLVEHFDFRQGGEYILVFLKMYFTLRVRQFGCHIGNVQCTCFFSKLKPPLSWKLNNSSRSDRESGSVGILGHWDSIHFYSVVLSLLFTPHLPPLL